MEKMCLNCMNAIQLGGKDKPGDSEDVWICVLYSTLAQLVLLDKDSSPIKNGKQICSEYEFDEEGVLVGEEGEELEDEEPETKKEEPETEDLNDINVEALKKELED